MLKNISVRYDASQDRLVVHVTTLDAGQSITHHLHLTRRLWIEARVQLQALIDISAAAPSRLSEADRSVVSAAHHQAQAAQARVEKRPTPEPQPTDKTDLVSLLRFGRRKDDGKWVLQFNLHSKAEMSMVLGDATFHGVAAAFMQQEARTDWGLVPLPAAHANQQAPVSSAAFH